MSRAAWLALSLSLTIPAAFPRAARADAAGGPSPLYVLTLTTDDADDQADALTQALRARVRQDRVWSLQETPQSFETLSIGLKCPPKPDAACLQRIGDQLHADHFVWGSLGKGRPGEVKANIHLWTRGKPDSEATDAYSDNLKDSSDDALRKVASTLFDKISGEKQTGTVVVHAGTGGGEVLIDGNSRGALNGGVARLDVPVGSHTVAVRVPGFTATSQVASVSAGAPQDVVLTLMAQEAPASSPEQTESPSSFPLRKVVSYGAIVVGGGLLIASVVEAAQWASDSDASNTDRLNVPSTVTDVCATPLNEAALDACHRNRDAITASALAWVFGAVGVTAVGTGLVLLITDREPSSETRSSGALRTRSKASFDVVPSVGPKGGDLSLRLRF